MTVNYTTNLALGQPVTGTESGTWGDDVNNAVTSYLDIAIAGGLAITVTTADVTLTLTQGTSSATNIGSTTAQYAILNVSGAMTAARSLILPSSSRQYVINNNTTGGFLLTVKGSATSGVTMVNGEKAHVFWNGSDYAKLSNAQGGEGSFSSITDSGNLTFTGTGNRITGDFSNATASNRVIFQTSTASANTRIGMMPNAASTGTAGPVLYSTNDPDNASVFDIRITDGSQAALISTFNGTGTYLPMAFQTGGSERMRLTSSGNVGIGTSSPQVKLQVNSTANTASGNIAWDTTGATATLAFTGTSAIDAGPSISFSDQGTVSLAAIKGAKAGTNQGYLSFLTTNYSAGQYATERMRIDSSGNVGIGTSSPGYKLTVAGASGSAIVNLLETGVRSWAIRAGGTATNTFDIADLTAAETRMTIDSSGNVGIGTSSPSTLLTVSAKTNDVEALRINALGASGGVQGKVELGFGYYDGGVAPSAAIGLEEASIASSGGNLLFKTRPDGSSDSTRPTERMRIDPIGRVGINKTNPSSTLDVVGNVEVATSTAAGAGYGIQVTQASGADRDIFLAGVNGVSNGLQVQYVSSAMKYTLTDLGTGTVTSTSGVLSAVSDQNMKVADGEIENAIDKVLSLKPRYFYWKDKDGNADTAKRRQLGFYAQEVNAVVPEASPAPIVESDGWGVYDRSLVATLTAAIQEQQAIITSLTARIEALEST